MGFWALTPTSLFFSSLLSRIENRSCQISHIPGDDCDLMHLSSKTFGIFLRHNNIQKLKTSTLLSKSSIEKDLSLRLSCFLLPVTAKGLPTNGFFYRPASSYSLRVPATIPAEPNPGEEHQETPSIEGASTNDCSKVYSTPGLQHESFRTLKGGLTEKRKSLRASSL